MRGWAIRQVLRFTICLQNHLTLTPIAGEYQKQEQTGAEEGSTVGPVVGKIWCLQLNSIL